MTELNKLSYAELLALNEKLTTEIASRNDKEKKKATKDWLLAKGQEYIPAIEALKKKYEKLLAACESPKSVVLRVKMDVFIDPVLDFEDIISDEYHKERYELFDIRTEGELLNKDAIGKLGEVVQDNIDNVMENVCDESIHLVPKFADLIDEFLDEVNALKDEFEDESKGSTNLGEVVKQHCSMLKTNAKKKAKK